MEKIIYSSLSDEDYVDHIELAKLHYNNLSNELLARLGFDFLCLYYSCILSSSSTVGSIAKLEGKIIGYNLITINNSIFSKLLRKNFVQTLFYLLRYFFVNPLKIFSFLKLYLYIGFLLQRKVDAFGQKKAEMLIAVVDKKYRRREFIKKYKEDIAYTLICNTLLECKREKVDVVFQYVDKSNLLVNLLMKKVGFITQYRFHAFDVTRELLIMKIDKKGGFNGK